MNYRVIAALLVCLVSAAPLPAGYSDEHGWQLAELDALAEKSPIRGVSHGGGFYELAWLTVTPVSRGYEVSIQVGGTLAQPDTATGKLIGKLVHPWDLADFCFERRPTETSDQGWSLRLQLAERRAKAGGPYTPADQVFSLNHEADGTLAALEATRFKKSLGCLRFMRRHIRFTRPEIHWVGVEWLEDGPVLLHQ